MAHRRPRRAARDEGVHREGVRGSRAALILRSSTRHSRGVRLEGWPEARSRPWPWFETRRLRDAPHHEAFETSVDADASTDPQDEVWRSYPARGTAQGRAARSFAAKAAISSLCRAVMSS